MQKQQHFQDASSREKKKPVSSFSSGIAGTPFYSVYYPQAYLLPQIHIYAPATHKLAKAHQPSFPDIQARQFTGDKMWQDFSPTNELQGILIGRRGSSNNWVTA